MCGERPVAVLLGDRVHVRRRACLDGIAFEAGLSRDTPSVVDAAQEVVF